MIWVIKTTLINYSMMEETESIKQFGIEVEVPEQPDNSTLLRRLFRYPKNSSSASSLYQSTSKTSTSVTPLYDLNGERTCSCLQIRRYKYLIAILAILVSISVVVILVTTLKNEETIYVHLVPHSHDDVGWLQRADFYFSYLVRHILTNVVNELQLNSSRRFSYGEMAYFWKWWDLQTDEKKEIVRKLVNSGQLEFIGGGWSMNDEAVTYYQNIIDQMSWGFRFLNDTFGEAGRPTIGWQIDTFGHSREMASILAEMGFNAVIFARISMDNKIARMSHHTMETVWEGSSYLGSSSSIFTSIMYKHYNPPKGFHFEKSENFDLEDDDKISTFIGHIRTQAKEYKTNHILIPMGDDFTYYNAKIWYTNVDKLISFVHNREVNIHLFYSTPSTYIKSLNSLNKSWPTKVGDFMPLGCCDPRSYWSGYYTSRPSLKYLERLSNDFLQISKQLYSLVNLAPKWMSYLTKLREVLGTMQHHDAITGTSKQHVTDDYVLSMYKALKSGSYITEQAFRILNQKRNETTNEVLWKSCLYLNISYCPESSQRGFHVRVYNPLSWNVSKYMRFPALPGRYNVISQAGDSIPYQKVKLSEKVLKLFRFDSKTSSELVFKVNNVPALGYKTFYIRKISNETKEEAEDDVKGDPYISIGNEIFQLYFNTESGLMSHMYRNNTRIQIEQQLMFYIGVHHYSGAYKFLPDEDAKINFDNVQVRVINRGELVEEVEQTFSDWASQIIRIYKGEESVEFEWLIGPIPNSDYFGKEVISLYKTEIKNEGVFYTDSNGRQMMKRKRNFREDWNAENVEAIAGNYYPVTNRIFIEDDKYQMFILNDRAQGGSSVQDGEIELMLHRRLCYDDFLGVNEPLNETEYNDGLVVRGKHWLYIKELDTNNIQETKKHTYHKQLDVWPFFKPAASNAFNHVYLQEFSGLQRPLPPYVHILTLEPWRPNAILLRLENTHELPFNSSTQEVSLKGLFTTFDVVSARETTLGGNQWLSEEKRMVWLSESSDHEGIPTSHISEDILSGNMTVSLNPMQIRTFILQVVYN